MKNSIYLVLITLSVLFSSCSKSDDSSSSGTSFNCTIDGKKFSASDLFAYAVQFGNNYTVYGATAGAEIMYMNFDNSQGVGTYTFNLNSAGNSLYYTNASGKLFWTLEEGATGTVSITKKTATRVEGTFSFPKVVSDEDNSKSIAITNGTFAVNFR